MWIVIVFYKGSVQLICLTVGMLAVLIATAAIFCSGRAARNLPYNISNNAYVNEQFRFNVLQLLAAASVLAMGFALTKPALAGGECDELRGDERILPGESIPYLGPAWKSWALPRKGDVDDALARLDYGDELPLVYPIDLNKDRNNELLLTTPGGRLCGNAGCPNILLAPETMKRIGGVLRASGDFGRTRERVSSHSVLQPLSGIGYRAQASIRMSSTGARIASFLTRSSTTVASNNGVAASGTTDSTRS